MCCEITCNIPYKEYLLSFVISKNFSDAFKLCERIYNRGFFWMLILTYLLRISCWKLRWTNVNQVLLLIFLLFLLFMCQFLWIIWRGVIMGLLFNLFVKDRLNYLLLGWIRVLIDNLIVASVMKSKVWVIYKVSM